VLLVGSGVAGRARRVGRAVGAKRISLVRDAVAVLDTVLVQVVVAHPRFVPRARTQDDE